jgi:hypothetical protein
MIGYKVIHHVPGRIRIEIPAIKGLSMETLKQLSVIPIPAGIRDVRPNPFTGTMVIIYEPENIDILEYIKSMASNPELQKITNLTGRDSLLPLRITF